eukprot:NODE_3829_length_910_cov_15.758420_g3523_i0.p1 GENE.NODE_3829_length_910_cov_15.758420_g3523_i0~~NODE_3829_length_910_cov_15.758420_g3523_i0.p1  ORF type:complete len:120 (+),score=30.66 NODE_3829_length_910_cov_15.758420_g3523_i0:329-688(+)
MQTCKLLPVGLLELAVFCGDPINMVLSVSGEVLGNPLTLKVRGLLCDANRFFGVLDVLLDAQDAFVKHSVLFLNPQQTTLALDPPRLFFLTVCSWLKFEQKLFAFLLECCQAFFVLKTN